MFAPRFDGFLAEEGAGGVGCDCGGSCRSGHSCGCGGKGSGSGSACGCDGGDYDGLLVQPKKRLGERARGLGGEDPPGGGGGSSGGGDPDPEPDCCDDFLTGKRYCGDRVARNVIRDRITGKTHRCEDWRWGGYPGCAGFMDPVAAGAGVPTWTALNDGSGCESCVWDIRPQADGQCLVTFMIRCPGDKEDVNVAVQPKATCGMDITEAMWRLNLELERFFSDRDKKREVCGNRALWIRPAFYDREDGWDICELAWQKSKFCDDSCCQPSCKQTVHINGHCWYAHYVNYWLWGFLQKQCEDYFPMEPLELPIYLHRAMSILDGEMSYEAAGRAWWVRAGYENVWLDPRTSTRYVYNRFHQMEIAQEVPRDGFGYEVDKECASCGKEYKGELTAYIRSVNADGQGVVYGIRSGMRPWLIDGGEAPPHCYPGDTHKETEGTRVRRRVELGE